MPKFTVTGREVVYYLKVVEAESVQDVKDQWLSGASYFDHEDIEETADFSLGDIEQQVEMKKYKVKVTFIGHKYYDIDAEDKRQACDLAEDLGNDSGLTESEIGMVQAVEVDEVTNES
jgi:hypothetical protein